MERSHAEWVEGLFFEYKAVLEAFLRRRTRTPQEISDLSQEVYLRLLRVNDVEAVRDPEAYLFAVAHNLIKERAMLARRQGTSVEISESFGEELVADTRSPDYDMDSAKCGRRLMAVLDELSPKCRAAVILQYRDGLSYAEIAAALKVSANMVKKYRSYALAHCRRRMRHWG
jgi:RNA polymerase sigma factor (sigma-70 family)